MRGAVKRFLVRRTFDAVPADGQGLDGVVELVDMSGGASNVTVGQSVADLTALAAITKGDTRPDRQIRFVESGSASYSYDEQASSGDVQPNDSDGTGTGFGNGWWSKHTAVAQAHVSSHISGSDKFPDHVQTLYVGKHGNDANAGKTPADAFLTFGAAITAAGTPADEANAVGIVCLDDGEYVEVLTGVAFVNIYAPLATLNVTGPTNTMVGGCHWTFRRIYTGSTAVRVSGSGIAYLNVGEVTGTINSNVIDMRGSGTLVLNVGRIIGVQGACLWINSGTVQGHVGSIEAGIGTGIFVMYGASMDMVVETITGGVASIGIEVYADMGNGGEARGVIGNIDVSGIGINVNTPFDDSCYAALTVGRLNGGTAAYYVGAHGTLSLTCSDITGARTIEVGGLTNVNGEVENKALTTGATTPTIATIAIPDDTSVLVNVHVVAFRTNGADQVAYKKAALVYRRSAGIAVLQAVEDVMTDIESDVNFDATIGVDGGNNAIITVTGVAAKTMRWKSRHTVTEMS